MEAMDQRGNPSAIYGEGQGRRRRMGNAAGAIIITAIYTNNFTTVITNSSPLYAAV